jgi:multimeric flavodoxin WrbA
VVKAIGIAGSPRREGNSTMLLDAALKGAASAGAGVALIRLNDLTFRGCQACDPCAPDGDCILKDDLIPVFAALRLADVWILASPIYRDGLSGQFKSFFDRCCCWEGQNRLPGRRRAAMIVTYADKERDDYRKVAETVPFYLSWMGDFGDVEVMAAAELGPAGAVSARPDLLAKAEALGRSLVEGLEPPSTAGR